MNVGDGALLTYSLWALLAAGLSELFLFRILSRVGVHIPKQGLVLDVYHLLTSIGSFTFNLATILVFLALALVALSALRRRPQSRQMALVPLLVLGLAGASFLLVFAEETPTVSFTYGLASLAVMLLIVIHAWSERGAETPRKLVVTFIVLAYLASQYYALANQAYRALGISEAPPGGAAALQIGEALLVANAFLIFWAWSDLPARPGGQGRWRPFGLQVAVAAFLVVAFVGAYTGRDSATAAILSLWTLGLTLYLPLPLYALALALYGATVVSCLRHPARTNEAIALALLPVAGLALELTYHHLIAVVALLLLARVVIPHKAFHPWKAAP